MNSPIIPPGRVTKTEAMSILKRSLKPTERILREAALAVEYVKTGAHPLATYDRAEVEQIARNMESKTLNARAVTRYDSPKIARLESATIQSFAALPAPIPPTSASALRQSVPVADRPLLTRREAIALGYPAQLLDTWRDDPHSGVVVRYGVKRYKFSASALRRKVDQL